MTKNKTLTGKIYKITVHTRGAAFGVCAKVTAANGRVVHVTRDFPLGCKYQARCAAQSWCAGHDIVGV
jgi:hypothetical protein